MSAIGALRRLEKDKSKNVPENKGVKALFLNLPSRIRDSRAVKRTVSFAKGSWVLSSRWVWVLSTTLLITLVPLSIELLREEQTNEVVKELVAKGFSYGAIQQMGYSIQQESTLSADVAAAAE